MGWDTEEHDEWVDDEVENEDDLPDPNQLFIPGVVGEDEDAAP